MSPIVDLHVVVEEHYVDGRLDLALAMAGEALAADPDDGRMWELKGLVYRSAGECRAAREALETATLFVPLQAVARCALADCYACEGPCRLAYDMYRSLLDDPGLPSELLLPIAAGLDRVGASALALRVCREAAERDPDVPRVWHDLACYLGRCGYPPRLVLASARKAVALAPEDGRYRIGLACLLHRSGQTAEAIAVAERLNDSQIADAGCDCCLRRLADVFDTAGRSDQADACRHRAWELEAQRDLDG